MKDADHITSSDDTMALATMIRHRAMVRSYLDRFTGALERRAATHDLSKLRDDELHGFAEINAVSRTQKYGSPEYLASLERADEVVQLHYSRNTHHPEHHPTGVDDMGLLDLIEMVADWQAAADVYGNSSFEDGMPIQVERFGLTPEQVGLIELIHDVLTGKTK